MNFVFFKKYLFSFIFSKKNQKFLKHYFQILSTYLVLFFPKKSKIFKTLFPSFYYSLLVDKWIFLKNF